MAWRLPFGYMLFVLLFLFIFDFSPLVRPFLSTPLQDMSIYPRFLEDLVWLPAVLYDPSFLLHDEVVERISLVALSECLFIRSSNFDFLLIVSLLDFFFSGWLLNYHFYFFFLFIQSQLIPWLPSWLVLIWWSILHRCST